MNRTQLVAALAAVTAGCATIQLPPEQLEQAQATVKSAEELGAAEVPTAKLHLQFSRDEQLSARKLAKAGNDGATLLLACSQADADVALALAREAWVRRQALQAAEEAAALRTRGSTP